LNHVLIGPTAAYQTWSDEDVDLVPEPAIATFYHVGYDRVSVQRGGMQDN
jgi:hypothetical protein